jgi:hypothetical protein
MNITEIEVEKIDGSTVTHVIIDNGDGSFTSMTKTHFDELEAAKENGTIS